MTINRLLTFAEMEIKMNKQKSELLIKGFAILACLVLLFAPYGAAAGNQGVDPWWDVVSDDETPSTYYDSMLYSEIAPRLREIQDSSNRVKVEVIGQSAGGRDMYLVTLSDPQAMGRLGSYQAIRKLMLTDPDRAQEMIDLLGDFKVPVFINGSIHGNEYPGVDAAMQLDTEDAVHRRVSVHGLFTLVLL